jgi:glycosyltransferase involved in cell wall biosynthesis
MSELILVVPVFNEAKRLHADPWLAWLTADRTRTLYFVDDGSTDNTATLLEQLRNLAPDQVEILRLPANAGKAAAVRLGMLRALEETSRYAGFIDADLAAPLSEVTLLHDELEAHREVWAAFGSRAKLLGRRIVRSERRHYVGRVFATCASIAVGLPVYDTQCGLKLFRNVPPVRDAFAQPFHSRWIFDVELLARLADAAGSDAESRIREVPLEHWEERGGSRLGITDFVRAPLELLRIRRGRVR